MRTEPFISLTAVLAAAALSGCVEAEDQNVELENSSGKADGNSGSVVTITPGRDTVLSFGCEDHGGCDVKLDLKPHGREVNESARLLFRATGQRQGSFEYGRLTIERSGSSNVVDDARLAGAYSEFDDKIGDGYALWDGPDYTGTFFVEENARASLRVSWPHELLAGTGVEKPSITIGIWAEWSAAR